jgi:hypothetical protein
VTYIYLRKFADEWPNYLAGLDKVRGLCGDLRGSRPELLLSSVGRLGVLACWTQGKKYRLVESEISEISCLPAGSEIFPLSFEIFIF